MPKGVPVITKKGGRSDIQIVTLFNIYFTIDARIRWDRLKP